MVSGHVRAGLAVGLGWLDAVGSLDRQGCGWV